MNCEQMRNLLDEYVDGELSAEGRRAVERHLAGCEACRAELEALKKTAALVGSLPKVNAPEGLARGVEAALASSARRKRAVLVRWVGGWGSLAAAAATLVIVIKYAPWEPAREQSARPLR